MDYRRFSKGPVLSANTFDPMCPIIKNISVKAVKLGGIKVRFRKIGIGSYGDDRTFALLVFKYELLIFMKSNITPADTNHFCNVHVREVPAKKSNGPCYMVGFPFPCECTSV